MSDLLSGAKSQSGQGGLGIGLINLIGQGEANQAARASNATTNKWAPLLALNKAGNGSPQMKVPQATFSNTINPALANAMQMGGSAAGGVAGGGGDQTDQEMQAMDNILNGGGSSQDAALLGIPGEAGGGCVPQKYAMGGMPMMNKGMISRPMARPAMMPMRSASPMMSQMKYAGGGHIMKMLSGGGIPGQAKVPGDSVQNDTQLIAASPGEVVLPRTVAKDGMDGKKWKVAAYLNEVKRHGPGAMPLKSGASSPSKSISPWTAMACGGMAR